MRASISRSFMRNSKTAFCGLTPVGGVSSGDRPLALSCVSKPIKPHDCGAGTYTYGCAACGLEAEGGVSLRPLAIDASRGTWLWQSAFLGALKHPAAAATPQ